MLPITVSPEFELCDSPQFTVSPGFGLCDSPQFTVSNDQLIIRYFIFV